MKKIAYDQMFANELTHAWYVGTRKLMLSQVEKYVKKDSKILDAGCGTGGTIAFLKKNGFKNIYGIDKSKYAILLCKKRQLNKVSQADINKVPYNKNTFDAVICLDVLYHKGVNLKDALSEASRVLKKGGIFYSQEPAFNWLKSEHDVAIDTQRRFKKREIMNIFARSGFKNIKSSYFNFLFFIPIILSRLKNKLIGQKIEGSDVNELPGLLNYLLLLSLRLESMLIKYITLPFGISVVSIWKK